MGMRGSSVKKEMPASSVSRGNGINGKFIIGVGVIFLAFWLVCFVTQITTNEAWLHGDTSINVFRPDWWVVIQPVMFAIGQSPDPMAVLFGWGIEILYLGFTVAGFALIHHSIHQSGKILGVLFEIIAYSAIALNWFTDYNYGTLGSGQWGHAAFATMTAFVVGTFGNIGMFLIKFGYDKV